MPPPNPELECHLLPPWQVIVGEGSHPDKVKVYGPGVEKTGLKANEPTYFTVDCSEAGQGVYGGETFMLGKWRG